MTTTATTVTTTATAAHTGGQFHEGRLQRGVLGGQLPEHEAVFVRQFTDASGAAPGDLQRLLVPRA
ncbi:hypothetical protein [Streptomyces sp. NPDC088350]|uniref:hypothetical protein n=1 Tax=Streptomyces sp. NPDC088350 TaxID=3365854 RepID=UPI0037FC6FC6